MINYKEQEKTEEQLIEENKFDEKRYQDYASLSKSSTKPYLMISELIDNSFASYENGLGNKEKLKIQIFINMSKDLKKCYIRCEDNAYGMPRLQLQSAIKINKLNTNSKSNKNVHGRGLKQSAFYFGKKLYISTNTSFRQDTCSEITIEIKDGENNNLNDVIEIKPIKGYSKKRGTIVKISNFYKKRIVKDKDKSYKMIRRQLEWRYGRLIKNNVLEIHVHHSLDPKNNLWEEEHYKGFSPTPGKFIDFYENNDEDKLRLESVRKEISKTADEIRDKTSNIAHKHEIEALKEKLIDFIENSQEKEEVFFRWETSFMDEKINLNFGYMKTGVQKYSGVTIYEGDRAIYHGPNNDEQKTYWYKLSLSSGSSENAFIGSVDLTDRVTTTTDKSQLDFSIDEKDELDWILKAAFNVSKYIKISSNKSRNDTQNVGLQKEDYHDLENTFTGKFNQKYVTFIRRNEDAIICDLKIHDEKWKVELDIKNENLDEPKTLLVCDNQNISVDKKYIKLIIFKNHHFWNNMREIGSKKFLAEILIPFGLVFSQLIIVQKCYGDEKLVKNINKMMHIYYG